MIISNLIKATIQKVVTENRLIGTNSLKGRIPLLGSFKNLGRLWLAYTELQGDFDMLQLMIDDSGHFTQPERSLRWSDLHEIKSVSFCITRSQ